MTSTFNEVFSSMKNRSAAWALAALASTALVNVGAARAAVFTQADVVSAAPAAQSVTFDVFLPLRNVDGLTALLARQQNPASVDFHKWLTPAQFAAQFGPSQATKDAVAHELAGQGFAVKQMSRSLRVTGAAAAVQKAFATTLGMVRTDAAGHLRPVALNGLKLSPTLTAAGARVFAFSAHKSEYHTFAQRVAANPSNRYGRDGGYWYDDLRQSYSYPAVNATATAHDGTVKPLNGSGAVVAALMSSDVLDSDIANLFAHEHYSTVSGQPAPVLAGRRYIGGAIPGDTSGAFDEASLDVQSELGGAPGATVLLYDIATLNDDVISAAYVDVDEFNEVDAISASFGTCELTYAPVYNNGVDYTGVLFANHELFMQGNVQGITFMVSSGDSAGRECPSLNYFNKTASQGGPNKATYVPSVSSPADDSAVTAVGGTNLVTVAIPSNAVPPYHFALNATYVKENTYGDPEIAHDYYYGYGYYVYGGYWGSGGGVSQIFSKPANQSALGGSAAGRLVPDIAMQMGGCPGDAKFPCNGGDRPIDGNGNTDRSYGVFALSGGFYGFIGTSLSSPEFASVVALMVELHGRQGNLNPYLYATASAQKAGSAQPAYHRGIPGFNGVVPNSVPGMLYNYGIGVGTPYVANLIGLPAGTKLAGNPRTPSNP